MSAQHDPEPGAVAAVIPADIRRYVVARGERGQAASVTLTRGDGENPINLTVSMFGISAPEARALGRLLIQLAAELE